MPTTYDIALKLSLDGVNLVNKGFENLKNTLGTTSKGLGGVFNRAKKDMAELAKSKLFSIVSIASIGLAFKKVMDMGVEFEAEFTRGIANMTESIQKNSKEWKELENLVTQLGATTEFSATEASQAFTSWAKSGKTVKEIYELLPKSIDFATASGQDLATAADMMAKNLGVFSLESKNMVQLGKNVERINDSMVAITKSAQMNINELFETAQHAGSIFITAGQDMETFNAAAAVLSKNAIVGSEAGTSLRRVMTSIINPTDKARKLFKQLGIEVTNQDGSIRDLADIVDTMADKYQTMTEKQRGFFLEIVAGKTGMVGFNALLKAGGDELRRFIDIQKQAKDTTENMANTIRNTTMQALDNLGGSIGSVAKTIFYILQPLINSVLTVLTKFFETLSNNKALMLVMITAIGSLAFAFSPVTFVVMAVVGALVLLHKIGVTLAKAFPNLTGIIVIGLKTVSNMIYDVISFIPEMILKALTYISKLLSKIPGIGKIFNGATDFFKSIDDDFDKLRFDITKDVLNLDFEKDKEKTNNVLNFDFKKYKEKTNNKVLMNTIPTQNQSQTKSTLDINLTAPKGWGVFQNLTNSNPQLLINTAGGQ
jgi:TP901 family phage tail tape measure protein